MTQHRHGKTGRASVEPVKPFPARHRRCAGGGDRCDRRNRGRGLTLTGISPSPRVTARTGYLSRLVSTAPSSATKIASRLAGSVVLAFALIR